MLKEGDESVLSGAGSSIAVDTLDPRLTSDLYRLEDRDFLESNVTDELYFPIRTQIEKVSLGYVNSLPQVRPEIEAQPLEDLAASIDQEGLINPPDYALLSATELNSYLDLVNKTWKADVSIDEFRATSSGLYLIAAAGHRRTRAIELIATEQGHDDFDSVWLDAKVYHHPSVHEILSVQMAENTFVSPPPHREAALIEEVFRTGLAAGRYESRADFKRKSPLGETKIDHAIHFMELPESIRGLVADNDSNELNYTRAVLLRRIIEPYSAYLRRHPKLIPHLKLADYDLPSNIQIEQAVEEKMLRILSNAPLKRPWRTDNLKKHVRGLCESWNSEIAEDALVMFDSAAERDRDARERAEVKEVVAVLSGAIQFARMTARVVVSLPERVRTKTTKQQRRVAGALSKLAVVAEEASSAINSQISSDDM